MKVFANNKKFWGFLALAIALTVILFLSACSHSAPQRHTPEKEQVEELVYVDTVFAVGVNKECAPQIYCEIVFSHNLYLSCNDKLYQERRDYNHPFYVEPGDLCVVRVVKRNGELNVTLLENLNKKELAELEVYWHTGLIDYD